MGWTAKDPKYSFDANLCKNPFDKNAPKANSFIPYGSDELFGLFCFPDLEELPATFNGVDLDNIIG